MRILALIYMVAGLAALFMGYSQSQPATLALGAGVSVVSVGLFFHVRVCGYLMAGMFAVMAGLILLAAVLSRGLGVSQIVQCLIFGGLGYWCFSWAWNRGVEQAAAKPKAVPSRPAAPVQIDAEVQDSTDTPPLRTQTSEPVFSGKWAWVWLVALGSFIPFGLAVWYFVNRDTKPLAKTVTAAPVTVPTTGVPTNKTIPATRPKAALLPQPAPAQPPKPAPAAQAATALPWQIATLKPANLEVRNMKPVPLVVGTNRLDWVVVPEFFRQRPAEIMALTVAAGVETGEAKFTVRSSGYAIIACGYGYQGNPSGDWEPTRWTVSDFEARGWTPIPPAAVGGMLTMVDVNRVMTLFWKRVEAGETGRIRCNKYYPPFFILLSDGGPQ